MSGDYLVLMGGSEAAKTIVEVADLELVLDAPGLKVLAASDAPLIRLGAHGVVLGVVFEPREGGRIAAFAAPEIDRILASRGQWLVDRAWGGYLATGLDPGAASPWAVRDPSGATSAYRVQHQGLTILCSRLDVLIQAGLPRPQLDWPAVGQILAYPHLRGRRTGMRGVDELLPGCRLTVRHGASPIEDLVWSPWTYAAPRRQILDVRAAAERVREAVDRSVRGWASVSSPLLLELSGGLDSSIIAAGLAGTPSATFVNFHTTGAEADERHYARLAAAAADHDLVERLAQPQAVDIRQARAGCHPRPASQALLQPIEAAFATLGRDLEVKAFFSGLGGDNVFCAVSSAAPAADALLSFGPGARFVGALDDLCRRHGCTLWDAAGQALRKALASRRPRPPAPVLDLLAPDLCPITPAHPWQEAVNDALPGKREHVASLLVAQGFLDRYDHAKIAPVRFPLLAQPVMEACLAVPTWMTNRAGRDRAVARQAFVDRLPRQIFERRTKSGLNAFMGLAFDHNRPALRDQLTRGWLVTAGLVDGAALVQRLDKPAPTPEDIARLMFLADVEVWARTFG